MGSWTIQHTIEMDQAKVASDIKSPRLLNRRPFKRFCFEICCRKFESCYAKTITKHMLEMCAVGLHEESRADFTRCWPNDLSTDTKRLLVIATFLHQLCKYFAFYSEAEPRDFLEDSNDGIEVQTAATYKLDICLSLASERKDICASAGWRHFRLYAPRLAKTARWVWAQTYSDLSTAMSEETLLEAFSCV